MSPLMFVPNHIVTSDLNYLCALAAVFILKPPHINNYYLLVFTVQYCI